MAASFFPEIVSPLARSNAARWRTHIRRRNRKRSDGAFAVVRSVAAPIRVVATWSSFDNPFHWQCLRSSHFIPALWLARVYLPIRHSLCCPNWDKDIRDSHHVLERLPLNQSLSLGSPEHRFGQTTRSGNAGKPGS